MSRKFPLLLVVLTLSLAALACAQATVDVGENETTLTVRLSESDLQTAIERVFDSPNAPQWENPSVNLQNGQIVVTGNYVRRDGGGTLPATMIVNVSASGGQVSVVVQSAQMAGYTMPQSEIDAFNARLAEGLSSRASQNNNPWTVTSVTITETELTLVASRPRNGN